MPATRRPVEVLVEQAASGAESLQDEASRLAQVVSRFRLEHGAVLLRG